MWEELTSASPASKSGMYQNKVIVCIGVSTHPPPSWKTPFFLVLLSPLQIVQAPSF